MKRVGFIINSRVPEPASLQRGMRPQHLLVGWDDRHSPMSFMRFRWIAREVNRRGDLRYELFKPWRRYAAVVFLKSMGGRCRHLVGRLQRQNVRAVFEANVDYYTEAEPSNLPGELAPSPAQRTAALEMTSNTDCVIASSRHLAKICRNYATNVYTVQDNILPALVPAGPPGPGVMDGRLQLWWSGMAVKLYDFLAIAGSLRQLAGKLHLHFVTKDPDAAMAGWPPEQRNALRELLAVIPHTFHRFRGIPDLLRLYHSGGGAIISPRFLDSPYNHSHTEWKLTLGMACGMPGLGSPLPSYEDAAKVAGNGSLEICRTEREWTEGIERIWRDPAAAMALGHAAAGRVLEFYGTPRLAAEHARAVGATLAGGNE